MKILEAINKVKQDSITENRKLYLYSDKKGYFVSWKWWPDWLFCAYPGGRTRATPMCIELVKKENPLWQE